MWPARPQNLILAVVLVVVQSAVSKKSKLEFSQESYAKELTEYHRINATVLHVRAKGCTGKVFYTIENKDVPFAIDGKGHISLLRPFNIDKKSYYNLVIKAETSGKNCEAKAKVYFRVMNMNKHRPSFESDEYMCFIAENTRSVHVVPKIRVNDLDHGEAGKIRKISIVESGLPFDFRFDSKDKKEAVMVATRTLDAEKVTGFMFDIVAEDNGDPPRKSLPVHVNCQVIDVNEFAPRFVQSHYTATIHHGKAYANILQVEATDKDIGDEYGRICKYTITTPNQPFNIDNYGVVHLIQPLGPEAFDQYKFTVSAFDCGGKVSPQEATVTINIAKDCDRDIVYLFEDYRQEPNRYLKSTSKKYCNYPPETGNDEGFLDLPGTFADNPFSLKMVQIVFRHGDRAPLLQNLPNTDRKVFDCSLDSHNIVIDHLFLDLKEMVKYINIRGLSPQVSQHPLLPDSREKFCKAGQLTVQGFLQLIAIGKHLRRQYKDLLNGLKGNEISVLSTNYDRTVQSAVAFLYGLLTKEGAMKARKLVINVTTDNWFRQRDDGSVMPCPALHMVTSKNKQSSEYVDGAQNLEVIMNHVSKLVDIPRPQLPTVILLADQVLTRLCHNHPLPCGPRGCISEKDAGALYQGAVWSFQHNYSAPSQILSHPLLVQITTRMLMKSDERTLNKFVLYSTHDNTLSALLLFMGLFDGDWLHYGTRVVFELWGNKMFRNSKDDKSSLENFMIRILVNGKVVTHKVNFCGGKLQFKEFCPAEELLKLLSKAGPNGMKEYYRHLCEELI